MKLQRPKYKEFPPDEFPDPTNSPYDVVELKYDGIWGQLLLEGYEWRLYSRTGQLKKYGILSEPVARTLLHGEYCVSSEWSVAHPEYYGQLALFGATTLEGVDIAHWSNAGQRTAIRALIRHLQFEEILHGLFLVFQYPLAFAESIWYVNEEFEGLVFKNSQAPWGTRFARMKRQVEMDYVCLGFEESESGKHAGVGVASIIGGLTFAGEDEPAPACRVCGITDEMRREFYRNPNAYVGRVFTAKGNRATKNGALRHPNFVRWRDDKYTDDCTWEARKARELKRPRRMG